MSDTTITTKMTAGALQTLRLIAATTGEKQYKVLNRLLAAEAARLALKAPK